MNFKTTAILLVLLLVVGGFLLFFSLRNPPVDPDDPNLEALFKFDPESVARLTFKRDDKVAEFEKRGRDWHQTQPVAFPLNDHAAQKNIIEATARLGITETIPDGQSEQTLADIGLDPPKASITLHLPDEQLTLHLGDRLGDGRGYLKIKGKPQIHVVTGKLHQTLFNQPTLQATVMEWRQTKIMGPAPGAAQRIELSFQNQTAKLIRDKNRWKLLSNGISGRADSAVIDKVLAAARSLVVRPNSFQDAPPQLAAFGLDKPTVVLRIDAATPDKKFKTYTLRIGATNQFSKQGFHFATWSTGSKPSNVIFEIAANPYMHLLAKQVDELRDPRPTPTTLGSINAYTLRWADKPPVKLHNPTTKQWVFDETNPGFKPDQTETQKLLEQIIGARAAAYLPGIEIKSTPAVEVELIKAGASELETLAVYDPKTIVAELGDRLKDLALDKHVLTMRKGESIGYIFARSSLWRVFEPLSFLRDRTVIDIASDNIKSLILTQPDGVRFHFTTKPQRGDDPRGNANIEWRLDGEPAFEQRDFDQLRQALFPLRADRWLDADEVVESTLTIEITTKDNQTFKIGVDPASGKGATSYKGEHRFTLPKPLIDALLAEYRFRAVLLIAPGQLASVTRTAGGKSITVTRNAKGEFSSKDGAVNKTLAAGLFDILSGLRAKRFVEKPKQLPAIDIAIVGRSISGHSFNLDLYKIDGNYILHLTGAVGSNKIDRWFTIDAATRKKLLGA